MKLALPAKVINFKKEDFHKPHEDADDNENGWTGVESTIAFRQILAPINLWCLNAAKHNQESRLKKK